MIIPKTEYKKMLQSQEKMQSQIEDLRKFVIETMRKEEVSPSVIKRLEKISRSLDKGKGKSFNSTPSFKSYLRCL